MNDLPSEIRTRFAPSPTGLLHIGSARTALFAWLFARRFGGKFILRIEDTDKERSDEKYELNIMEGLVWLGIDWDEGPETPDNYGPYRQKDRLEIYQKYADQLIEDNHAYWCFCTPEELEAEKKEQAEKKLPPRYSGKCQNLSSEEIAKFRAEGRKPALRFKIEDSIFENEPVVFKDLIKGEMSFDPTLFGDFVIMKSDGNPTFMFAGAIDDAEMKISHVIRGEDHLSNTPRQILLGRALKLSIPEYAHIPMILNSDRTKMSKRKNPVSLTQDYRDQGYLPEAMVNFLVLLGWSPSQQKADEIYDLKDIIEEFDLNEVGKSPAIFDSTKLDYFNGYYIRKMSLGELAKRCLPYLEKAGLAPKENELVLKAVGLVQERMKKISEVAALTSFFFRRPTYQAELLVVKGSTKEVTLQALKESLRVLEGESDFSHDSVEQLLRALATKIGVKAGEVLWPLRVALSGEPASPGTFELLEALGKDESLARIKTAIDMLQ